MDERSLEFRESGLNNFKLYFGEPTGYKIWSIFRLGLRRSNGGRLTITKAISW